MMKRLHYSISTSIIKTKGRVTLKCSGRLTSSVDVPPTKVYDLETSSSWSTSSLIKGLKVQNIYFCEQQARVITLVT